MSTALPMRSCHCRSRASTAPRSHHRGPVRQGGRRRADGLGSCDVPQCGYCQSGQIMAAAALLSENPKPTDADIDARAWRATSAGARPISASAPRSTHAARPAGGLSHAARSRMLDLTAAAGPEPPPLSDRRGVAGAGADRRLRPARLGAARQPGAPPTPGRPARSTPIVRIAPDNTVTVLSAFRDGPGRLHRHRHAGRPRSSTPTGPDAGRGRPGNPKLYGNLAWGGRPGDRRLDAPWPARSCAIGRPAPSHGRCWSPPPPRNGACRRARSWSTRACMTPCRAGKQRDASASSATGLAAHAARHRPAAQGPGEFRLIGKADSCGSTTWPRPRARRCSRIDVRLPGMLTAVVAHPPHFGAKVEEHRRAAAAKAVKGVVDVVADPARRRGRRPDACGRRSRAARR